MRAVTAGVEMVKSGQENDPPARKQSFWMTLPGILTAAAALITAVGGLVAALNSAGLLNIRSPEPPSGVSPDPPVDSPSSSRSRPSVSQDCFPQFFRGIAGDRIVTLEEGIGSRDIIGPDQSKEGVIAAQLTEGGQRIGAIKFRFFPGNDIFKVDAIVDATCQEIQKYFNADRGGDRRTLQN